MEEKKRVKENLIIFGITAVFIIGYFIKVGIDEHKRAESRAERQNDWFTTKLYIQGDFSYKGSKVIVNDITYDDNRLYVDVVFYNYKNPEKQITVEELYEAYDAFCAGKSEDTFTVLEKFKMDDIGSYYYHYKTFVRRNFPEGKEIATVTMEELQGITEKALVDLEQFYEELYKW